MFSLLQTDQILFSRGACFHYQDTAGGGDLDLPGYSGTAEEEIRCSVIISNNAIATEAGACVEHRASGYAEALGFF